MEPQVRQAQQRAYRYWYEDGLIDILLGAFFLLVGASSLLPQLDLPPTARTLIEGLRIGAIVVAALALRRFVRALKQRITYPRTGYVAYRARPRVLRWVKVGIGVAAGGLVGVLATSQSESVRWALLLVGVLVGSGFLYVGVRLRLLRYHLLALTSVLVGGVLALPDLPDDLRLAGFLCVVGGAQIVSGGITLISYLRRNPAHDAEGAGGDDAREETR